jgi:hypothetical protein
VGFGKSVEAKQKRHLGDIGQSGDRQLQKMSFASSVGRGHGAPWRISARET